jgi:hypothetical protein
LIDGLRTHEEGAIELEKEEIRGKYIHDIELRGIETKNIRCVSSSIMGLKLKGSAIAHTTP